MGLLNGLALAEGKGIKEYSMMDLIGWGGNAFFTAGDIIKEDIVQNAIAETTGVKFTEVLNLNGMTVTERLSILFAGQELPDVIACWYSDITDFAKMLIEEDLLWTFTNEELAVLAPNMYGLMSQASYGFVKDTYKLDVNVGLLHNAWAMTGEMAAAYPVFGEKALRYGSTGAFYTFRDDILKELFPDALTYDELQAKGEANGKLTMDDYKVEGLDTFADLKDYLYTVKKQYPDVTPANGWDVESFLRSFYGFNIFAEYDALNIEIITGPVDRKDEFSQALQILNTLFNDDLFDPNYGIEQASDELFWEKASNGKYAVVGANSDRSVDDLNAQLAQTGQTYKYVPVLIDFEAGINIYNNYASLQSANCGWIYMFNKMTLSEEDVALLMAYFDFFATPEGVDLRLWGPEGTGLWEEADGVRKWVDADFLAVLNEEIPVGEVKDFAYYGFFLGEGPAGDWRYLRPYFPALLMGNTRSLTTGLMTMETAGDAMPVKVGGDYLNVLVMNSLDGYYDNNFSAWNGSQVENKFFWAGGRMDIIRAECSKTVRANLSDFTAALEGLFDFLYTPYVYEDDNGEVFEFNIEDYAEAMRGYIEWLKPIKDGQTFPAGADLSKLD